MQSKFGKKNERKRNRKRTNLKRFVGGNRLKSGLMKGYCKRLSFERRRGESGVERCNTLKT
jgi:hypothetical protein